MGSAWPSAIPTTTAVPDLRGDDPSTATAAVKAAGFVLGTVSYTGVCSNAGHVLTQAPAACVLARLGSAVSVTVGKLKLCA